MKPYLLLIGLMLIVLPVSANISNPHWNPGRILLSNGDELEGELSYNWKAEIVQLKQGDRVKAYSAHQVNEFAYFDENANTLRRFSAVDYPVKANMVRPVFLEEFASGPYMVYRRLRHTREAIKLEKPIGYDNDEFLTTDFDNFRYFIFANGTFTDLDHFVRDLWPKMDEEFGPQLTNYASTRQLDMTSTGGRIVMISYYNYLKERAMAGNPVAMPASGVVGHEE